MWRHNLQQIINKKNIMLLLLCHNSCSLPSFICCDLMCKREIQSYWNIICWSLNLCIFLEIRTQRFKISWSSFFKQTTTTRKDKLCVLIHVSFITIDYQRLVRFIGCTKLIKSYFGKDFILISKQIFCSSLGNICDQINKK